MFSVASSILRVMFSNVLPALLAFGGFVAVIVGVNVLIKFVVNGMGFIEGISVHGYQEAKRIHEKSQPDAAFLDSSMQEKVKVLQRYLILFGIFYLLSLFGFAWVLAGLGCYVVYALRKLVKGESDNKTLTSAERVNEAFKQARRIVDTGRYVKHSFKAFKEGKEPLTPDEFTEQERRRLNQAEFNVVDTDGIRQNNDEFGGTKDNPINRVMRLADTIKGYVTGRTQETVLEERLGNFTVRERTPQPTISPEHIDVISQNEFWINTEPVANPLIVGCKVSEDVVPLLEIPSFHERSDSCHKMDAAANMQPLDKVEHNIKMSSLGYAGLTTPPILSAVRQRGTYDSLAVPFTKGVVTSLSYILTDELNGLTVHPNDTDLFNDLLKDGYGHLIIEDVVRCNFYLDEVVSKDPITLEPVDAAELHEDVVFRFVHNGGYFTLSRDKQPDWMNNTVDETKPLFKFTKTLGEGVNVEVAVVQTTDQTRVVLTDVCKYELYKNGYILQSRDIVDDIVLAFDKCQYKVEENGLFLGNLTIEPYYMALTCQNYRGERWLHPLTKNDLICNFSHNNVYRRNTASANPVPAVEDLYAAADMDSVEPKAQKNLTDVSVKGRHVAANNIDNNSNTSGIKSVDFDVSQTSSDAEFEKFINETGISSVKPLFSITLPDIGVLLNYWLSEDGSGVNADLSTIYDLIQNKAIGTALFNISKGLPGSIILEDGTTAYLSNGYKGILGLTLMARSQGSENNEKIFVNEFNYPSIFGWSAGSIPSTGNNLDVYFSDEDYPAVMPFAYTSQTASTLLLNNNRYLMLQEREAVIRSAAATGIPLDEFLKAEVTGMQLCKLINGTELYITEHEPFVWKISVKQNNSYYNIPIYRDMLPSLFY